MFLGLNPSVRMPEFANHTLPNVHKIKWYNGKVKERDDLEDNLEILKGLQNEQEKILTQYGSITGLWSGLVVLGYSTFVGIIIPTLLLPYPLNKYDDSATRNLLISLFFSALIALFIYLGFSMYRLTKKE